MEKYKALKEYIEQCNDKKMSYFYGSDSFEDIVSAFSIKDPLIRCKIASDLNSFLKEHFGNNGFVTITIRLLNIWLNR